MNDMSASPENRSRTLKGIPVAPGLACGRAVLWVEESLHVPHYPVSDVAGEMRRLAAARQQSRRELDALHEQVAGQAGSAEAAVFTAHRMFLDDKVLLKRVQLAVEGGLNVEASWSEAVGYYASQLENLPSPTLGARAADVRDVGRRVLRHLLGLPSGQLQLDEPVIIVAGDLSPSQTATLDKSKVLAFCTAEGGPTSHTAILARALGLPAVVALGPAILQVAAGDLLLVDGARGEVRLNPPPEELASFRSLSARDRQPEQDALDAASQPAVTLDGVALEVVANIAGWQEAQSALDFGAEGVGLFRTEFLYLDRASLPGETEQVAAYRKVFRVMGDKPVVVRTLDIGGDKSVAYLGFTREANPFLGWRAIRMNHGRPDVFKSQVRALLQAAAGADLRIMLPMISNLEEVTTARQLLEECRDELLGAGLPCAARVQFGIMVEVPSAALIASHLAPHVDFFSLGTNDLTQYTLAVDRTNARVAHLASAYHPAVLALIRMTVRAAHAHGKWAGLCGELAGDVLAVPLLLGLGLDELSMSPALIPAVKRAIRRCDRARCQQLADQCLSLSTSAEVVELLSASDSNLRPRWESP